MSQETSLCKIPYPDEDTDPWFDGFRETVAAIDANLFGLLSSAGSVIIPPPTIQYNAGVLTWDDDFVIPILGSAGFRFLVRFGPDLATRSLTLNDGDKVIIAIPVSAGADVVGHFSILSGAAQFQSGLYIFGMRYGNNFYANLPTMF